MPSPLKSSALIPEEWLSFLAHIGKKLPVPVEVHCIGAFAAATRYGMPFDADALEYIATQPPRGVDLLRTAANARSELSRKSGLHFRFCGAVDYIEDYDKRLKRLFSTRFGNLRLYAMEAHDLVLTHLSNQGSRDFTLVDFLVEKKAIKPSTLWRRYRHGLRPFVAHPRTLDSRVESLLKRYFAKNKTN